MYQAINGWTKERMKQQIRKYNDGTKAADVYDACVYQTESGNRCLVGCFIPDGHLGLKCGGDADGLLKRHPDLYASMPLEIHDLMQMQAKGHDWCSSTENIHDAAFEWIDENVIDGTEVTP